MIDWARTRGVLLSLIFSGSAKVAATRKTSIGPSYVNLKLQSETFGNCEILQTVTPIDIMLQKVVHRFYAPKLLAPFIKCLIFGESVMFERDIQMWSHKKFLRQPLLVKEEFAIKHFRNWYSQFYSENSRSYSEALEYFEW